MGWGSGNLGGGGASAGAVKKGAIGVKYPEGATCTVSNGSKTYTALDTSGAAAFIVEPGTWTVTASDGRFTNSETVTVAAGGWVEVTIDFFDGWLYKRGTQLNTDITGGLQQLIAPSYNGGFNFDEDKIALMGASGTWTNSRVSTVNAIYIDTTKFKTLKAIMRSYSSKSESNMSLIIFPADAIEGNQLLDPSASVAATSVGSNTNEVTLALDISALSPDYYYPEANIYNVNGCLNEWWFE